MSLLNNTGVFCHFCSPLWSTGILPLPPHQLEAPEVRPPLPPPLKAPETGADFLHQSALPGGGVGGGARNSVSGLPNWTPEARTLSSLGIKHQRPEQPLPSILSHRDWQNTEPSTVNTRTRNTSCHQYVTQRQLLEWKNNEPCTVNTRDRNTSCH